MTNDFKDFNDCVFVEDVATALGYSNTRDALSKHVDAEDKTTVAIRDTGSCWGECSILFCYHQILAE
ncbi:MAG: Bro-N domain-containing protein [Prevotella sp.]|nr:Bro-N domain-containing protein [Prevotella sp.]